MGPTGPNHVKLKYAKTEKDRTIFRSGPNWTGQDQTVQSTSALIDCLMHCNFQNYDHTALWIGDLGTLTQLLTVRFAGTHHRHNIVIILRVFY